MTWNFIDDALPDKEAHYFVLTLTNQCFTRWISYWEGNRFEDDCNEDAVIAWAKIEFPPVPSEEEICKHGEFITSKLLKMMEVGTYD